MSKKKWIHDKLKNKYTILAKKKKIKSRSWFKLNEIQKKNKILKKGYNIIDLGCHPGGWIQFIYKIIGNKGKIFCCDILKIKKIKNEIFIHGDICNKKIFNSIINKTKNHIINTILSDISPNLTGFNQIDNPKFKKIIKIILILCQKKLIKNGNLVIKCFLGRIFSNFLKKIKKIFIFVKILKPISSYISSKEIYIIAKGYKKNIN